MRATNGPDAGTAAYFFLLRGPKVETSAYFFLLTGPKTETTAYFFLLMGPKTKTSAYAIVPMRPTIGRRKSLSSPEGSRTENRQWSPPAVDITKRNHTCTDTPRPQYSV